MSPMADSHDPVILAFEASTALLSVAVNDRSGCLSQQTAKASFGQAADLVPMAVRVMQEAGLGFDRLSHVAAGVGPGSFTGIRVALAAAKGVCLAHDLPGIGVSGLQALACAAADGVSNRAMLCLADTRRNSFYCQAFTADAEPAGDIFEADEAHIPLMVPPALTASAFCLVGHAADRLFRVFAEAGRDDIALASPAGADTDAPVMLDASMIAGFAAKSLAKGAAPPLIPLYLSDPRLGPKKVKTA